MRERRPPAAAIILLLLLHCPRGAAGAGSADCPCVTTSPLASYIVSGVEVKNGEYTYPADFGVGACKGHESGYAPHCQSLRGISPPRWCDSKWCYVDPQSCKGEEFERSLFFPDAPEAYFSYSTCGSSNTFTDWFSSTQGTHDLTEVVDVMKSYVCSIEQSLEDALMHELKTEGGCGTPTPLPTTCPCGDACVTQLSWQQCVDFSATGSTKSTPPAQGNLIDGLSVCASKSAAAYFARIAAKEHVVKSRVAYAYMGTQSDGHMTQYPRTEWCPTDYDPRFRAWYASAASGPKDVVIILDMSGSMSIEAHGVTRVDLAKQAAKAVLKTLTDADFVSVVAFSSCAAAFSDTPVRATAVGVDQATQWVDALTPGGQTGFAAALKMTFDVFKNGHTSGQWTKCPGSAVALFLGDGDPTDSNPEWKGNSGRMVWLRNLNKATFEHLPGIPSDSERMASIMTYTLGDGITAGGRDVMRQIACENKGSYEHVGEGGGLKDAMASYYHLFGAAAFSSRNTCSIRWVLYQDSSSCTELLAACTGVHDFSSLSQAEQDQDEVGVLFGSVCIDANMMASLDGDKGLRSHPQWNSFWAQVENQQRTCSPPPTKEHIANLRGKVGMTCGNDVTASDSGGVGNTCGDYEPPRPLGLDYLPYSCNPSSSMDKCYVASKDSDGGEGNSSVMAIIIIVALLVVCCALALFFIKKQKKTAANANAMMQSNAMMGSGQSPAGAGAYSAPPVTPSQEYPPPLGGRGNPASPPGGRGARPRGNTPPPRHRAASRGPGTPPRHPNDLPASWLTRDRPPPKMYAVVPVTDPTTLAGLQSCFVTRSSELGKGRDVKEAQTKYTTLNVRMAWRIEHHTLWQKYTVALQEVRGQMSHAPHQVRRIPLRNSRGALQDGLRCWSDALNEQLDDGSNEVLVAHATKPDVIPSIVAAGLSEKYSGGLFGHAVYLAEDAGKCDQYVTVHSPGQHKELTDMLYADHGMKHPGPVFYMFICRATLGIAARTIDGMNSLDHQGQCVWAKGGSEQRELCMIPGTQPPVPYHSLIAELGKKVLRYREFMQFHCDRVYPLYLVAYTRR